jgi:hypothetical protein
MTEFISGKTYNNSEIYWPTDNVCLNNFPILPIATLCNYFEKKTGFGSCCEIERPPINHYCNTNHITLNVIHLEESEFFNLFYHNSSKYFCVNKALITNSNIIFSEQYYISNNSNVNHFSLYNEVLKCFEENYNISVNNVNPGSLISLQKEVYKTQSLASICGTQLGLSWDQVINTLISNGYIEYSANNNCAPIIFQVNFNFYSSCMNVYLNVTFQYKVYITGFSLKNKCVIPPKPCDSSSSSTTCDSSTTCRSSTSCDDSNSCSSDSETSSSSSGSITSSDCSCDN